MMSDPSLLLTSVQEGAAHGASSFLLFAEHLLQYLALAFMGTVYFFKIMWILKFKAGKERQAGTGDPSTTAKRGATYSLFNIFMPWSMASTRQHPLFYLQFGAFHVGVTCSIAMSVLIPIFPSTVDSPAAIYLLQTLFAAAFLVGCYRFLRRMFDPYIRAISTPDDYFSVALLVVWFAFSFMAAPNNTAVGFLAASYVDTEFWLLGYFLLTAFFLVYVPFSKISHYIFYPFTRWYLGKTLGHRGVYPMKIDSGELGRSFFKPNKFMEGKGK
jgi:nitrate reductase gamma subunit